MDQLLSPEHLFIGFLFYVVFLFSTTCHEAAHALVAKWGGDLTAWEGGQVTLNPLPHMRRELYGMVVFPLLSFFLLQGAMIGWASAPYDPNWARKYPRRAAWMALAGPATNYLLMLIAVVAIYAIRNTDLWTSAATGRSTPLATILMMCFSLNLLLGTFNLLPIQPLDGSSGIMLLMSEDTARKYIDWMRVNNFAFAGLLVGLLLFRYIYTPIEAIAMQLFFGR